MAGDCGYGTDDSDVKVSDWDETDGHGDETVGGLGRDSRGLSRKLDFRQRAFAE
jgi:hypothetical protein